MKERLQVGYLEGEAPGAWPLGSTVRKVNSQPGDGTPDGTLGTILSSFDVSAQVKAATYAYFVFWAGGVPVFVADTNPDGTPRLERVNE